MDEHLKRVMDEARWYLNQFPGEKQLPANLYLAIASAGGDAEAFETQLLKQREEQD